MTRRRATHCCFQAVFCRQKKISVRPSPQPLFPDNGCLLRVRQQNCWPCLSCPRKNPSMAFCHEYELQKSHGRSGFTAAASSGGLLNSRAARASKSFLKKKQAFDTNFEPSRGSVSRNTSPRICLQSTASRAARCRVVSRSDRLFLTSNGLLP